MTTATFLLLIGFGLLVALLAWFRSVNKANDAAAREVDWLPDELANAQLVLAEPPPFRVERPLPVVAKMDRAYRLKDGKLALVEFKTRRAHRVYASDVVELSMQRFALEHGGHGMASDIAYVVTQREGRNDRRTHRVKLLAVQDAEAVANRYQNIVTGKIRPTKTENLRLCRACAFRAVCRPDAR
jgi:CRISPR/Cas system-associated exonuclease Cas4 (RecB family)